MSMLSTLREGIVILDSDGLVIWLSPYSEQILGCRNIDVLRSHYSQVFQPAPGETVTLRQILEPAPGQTPANKITILDAQKHPLTLEVSVSRLAIDVKPGSRQELVLTIQSLGEEASEDQMRSEFLANMAHEFRTPLSSIAASIDLLSEEAPSMSPDEVIELTNTALMSTRHLQKLVNNLLERFTIDAGLFRLKCRPVVIEDVVQTNVSIMLPLLLRRRQWLILEISEDLPVTWADPDRLGQVLINLIDNASKFSPFGTAIILSAKYQQDALLISVLDSGSGIDLTNPEDVFMPYFTTGKLPGSPSGAGLGLPVVKAIIEAHGGRVGAENYPEGGSRFWFTIPVGREMLHDKGESDD